MALSKIDVANMLTGVTPVANGGTALSSGFLNGGGLVSVSQYRLTSTFTNSADPIASNWETPDTDGYGGLGTGVSESSGVFSFPATGLWLIIFNCSFNNSSADDRYANCSISTTTDNSSFDTAAKTFSNVPQGNFGTSTGANAVASFLFDVTNTTTHKCRVGIDVANANTQGTGDSGLNNTFVTFIRVGDT